jgi:hypothetical protein
VSVGTEVPRVGVRVVVLVTTVVAVTDVVAVIVTVDINFTVVVTDALGAGLAGAGDALGGLTGPAVSANGKVGEGGAAAVRVAEMPALSGLFWTKASTSSAPSVVRMGGRPSKVN